MVMNIEKKCFVRERAVDPVATSACR